MAICSTSIQRQGNEGQRSNLKCIGVELDNGVYWKMRKHCSCGRAMGLELRVIIYARKVRIRHVPVYVCETCCGYEIMPQVAGHMKALIAELGKAPSRQSISFAQRNELADVIRLFIADETDAHGEHWEQRFEAARQDRINLLLDLYRVASQSGDKAWKSQLQERLAQLPDCTNDPLLTDA